MFNEINYHHALSQENLYPLRRTFAKHVCRHVTQKGNHSRTYSNNHQYLFILNIQLTKMYVAYKSLGFLVTQTD